MAPAKNALSKDFEVPEVKYRIGCIESGLLLFLNYKQHVSDLQKNPPPWSGGILFLAYLGDFSGLTTYRWRLDKWRSVQPEANDGQRPCRTLS
jgi:hypothetical protein